MRKHLCIVISFCILSFVACSSSKTVKNSSKNATIICTESTYNMAADLVESYNANSEEDLQIKLVDNISNIKEEKNNKCAIIAYENKKLKKFNEAPLGIDGVAIGIHKEKGIENLTYENLNKILNGTIDDWKDISNKEGKIKILAFKEIDNFLKLENKNKIQYIDKEKILKSTMDKDTIALIPKMELYKEFEYVKLDNIELNDNNIKNGLYKITIPVNIYYNSKNKEALAGFMRYLKSDNGKKIIKKYYTCIDENS
ncbi:substrate-binding domain-containing protein [Haloimpatiens lingqiaonensis]|uniref:substrate-binding domain-containing protein n=1 Tax=Haloimpatiens lingqiaonensis TaxID=1380675 RepID=UPI0010FDDBA4|nr:substrate-binding domain-containing protein [Haloimpatiens lingqiaonensis]